MERVELRISYVYYIVVQTVEQLFSEIDRKVFENRIGISVVDGK